MMYLRAVAGVIVTALIVGSGAWLYFTGREHGLLS